jgi:hypothetical protein
MYKVSNQTTEYGNVVIIEQDEDGIEAPFFAVQQALKNRRLWRESGATKVRFLVGGKIMSPKEMESWSREEYKSLPKCPTCIKILSGNVFTHRLSGTDIFCTQACADQDYNQKIERLKDEEEIDYL